MLKKCLFSIMLCLTSFSLFAEEYWVDVRLATQYKRQHVDNAINIPLDDLRKKIGYLAKNKDDTIHVYCNSGRQSEIAKNVLTGMGYTNVIDEGGIEDILAREE